jgi:hypothetical protein
MINLTPKAPKLVAVIGDLVRSYDHMGNRNYYTEGVVIAATQGSFTATTTKRVLDGIVVDIEEETFHTYQLGWGNTNDAWWDYRVELVK